MEAAIKKAADEKFCSECGAVIRAKAEICPKCGVRQSVVAVASSENVFSTTPNGKNKLTAALFAVFLGGIGMHKFYLGHTTQGILYVLFCWTFIPVIVGIIEGIVLIAMSDTDFNKKYGGISSGEGTPTPETHVRCPDCKELVHREASVCRHCGCKLVPQ